MSTGLAATIVHLVDRDSPPVAAAAIALLRARLDPLRWRHQVVALDDGSHADWLARERVPFETVPLVGRAEPFRSLRLGRWLNEAIGSTLTRPSQASRAEASQTQVSRAVLGPGSVPATTSPPVILHAHSPRAAACATVAALPRRSVRAVPVLAEVYRQPELRAIRWLNWAGRRMDIRFVARSTELARLVAAGGVAPARIATVPAAVDAHRLAGIDRAAVRQALGLSTDHAPVLLASGWCHRRDDQKLALWAAAILSMLHPNLRIVVPGDGPARAELANWINQAGFGRIAVLPGRALGWPELVCAADVLIHAGSRGLGGCGRFEAEITPVAWAMLAGLAVVSADLPGLSELVRDGQTALVCRQGSPRELAMRIGQAIGDRDLRARLTTGARARAAEAFGPDRTLADYQQIYESI